MGYVIAKVASDADRYVVWSSYTECPIWIGDRAKLLTKLQREESDRANPPEERIQRADEHGSSALFPGGEPFLGWNYGTRSSCSAATYLDTC